MFDNEVSCEQASLGCLRPLSMAYSLLCLSKFHSLSALSSENFPYRIFVFIKTDNDLLYCVIENKLSLAYYVLYLFDFLSLHTYNNETLHGPSMFAVKMKIYGVR